MNTLDSVTFVGGLVFTIYVVFASAYWSEAARWADKIAKLSDEAALARARQNRTWAERVFRLATGLAVLTLVLTVLPVYFPGTTVGLICKWLLLIPLISMITLFVRYASGIYLVSID